MSGLNEQSSISVAFIDITGNNIFDTTAGNERTPDSLQHEAVRYTIPPESAQGRGILYADLEKLGINYVRIQWVDLINNIRFRVVPLDYFAKLMQTPRPGTSLTKVTLGLVSISVAEGFSAAGEYLYAVDLSTLKICPYAPGHASVMGLFEEKLPFLSPQNDLIVETDLCPRTILNRVLEFAKQKSGIEFLVGFETEFILLKKTKPIEAVNEYGWCNSPALPSGTIESQILEEIATALKESGVELQMYHAEAAPGQYEVITGPLPPLQAVDALIHTRETIYNIANKHGLRATLAPRVFMDNCGSAAHAHFSVHSKVPAKPSAHENLSITESSFLAGILEHLPSIALLCLPTTASYKRMIDGVWSGGTYVCWGTDNREAPIRLCNAHSPSSRNFELKTLDGTANPYLALAGVLGAGALGVAKSKELTIKDCRFETTAANMTENGRACLGIKDRLPLTWEEARNLFTKSTVINDFFGLNFMEKYLAVNALLKDRLTSGLNVDEELKLLIETY